MVDFNNRYSPAIPPEADPELARFLRSEFGRLQHALADAVVLPAFAGLEVSGVPATQTLTSSYAVLDCWDGVTPTIPERATASLTTKSITADEAGVYQLVASGGMDLASRPCTFAAHVNGTVTAAFAVTQASWSISALLSLSAGDIVDIRGKVASTTLDIDLTNAAFSIFRVSEIRA